MDSKFRLELMKERIKAWYEYFDGKPVNEWPMNMRAWHAKTSKDISELEAQINNEKQGE